MAADAAPKQPRPSHLRLHHPRNRSTERSYNPGYNPRAERDWTVPVFFTKSRDRSEGSVEVDIPAQAGADNVRALVADLASGTWRIEQDNRPPQTALVREEEGVAYFPAVRGKLKLTLVDRPDGR